MREYRDPTARREMARLMRKFARGGLTVDEFERDAELLADRDSNVAEAYNFAWYFYSDFGTDQQPRGQRLSPEARREWAKWVLFLMTSEEDYTGPSLAPQLLPLGAYVLLSCKLASLVSAKFPAIWLLVFPVVLYVVMPWIVFLVQSLVAKIRPLPDHWPFPSADAYIQAVSLSNPFERSNALDCFRT
jgi:hypothetical protein